MALLGELTFFRGDSYPIELTIKDKENSAAIDITGYSFTMTVNSEKDPADDANLQFFIAGVVDPDQVVNKGKVAITPSVDHTDLPSATYYYDIEMTDLSGNVRTIGKDKFKITQDITK